MLYTHAHTHTPLTFAHITDTHVTHMYPSHPRSLTGFFPQTERKIEAGQ